MAKITIDDLRELDTVELEREIEQLESALAEHIERARADIEGRKQVLKVVNLLKHGKPEKNPVKLGPGRPKVVRDEPPQKPTRVQRVQPTGGIRETQSDKILSALKGAKLKPADISTLTGIPRDDVVHFLENTDGIEVDFDGRWSRLY